MASIVETDSDTDAINRYLNAKHRADRALQQLDGRPGDERLVYQEQYRRTEAVHARREMIRRMKMRAWNEGHEAVCERGRDCQEHLNPYVLAHLMEEQDAD